VEVGGEVGVERVGKLAIEDGAELCAVIFEPDEEVSCSWLGGGTGTSKVEQVLGHVP
jgi:hypothetical protein